MKIRSILMSTALSLKAQAGEKTQTRRIIPDDWWRCLDPEDDKERALAVSMCPYGEPGDLLVVRESYYQRGHWIMTDEPTRSGLHYKWKFVAAPGPIAFEPPEGKVVYTSRHKEFPHVIQWNKRLGRFMPSKYSRLTLEIVDVRIERLQDISEADAKAEGAPLCNGHPERGAWWGNGPSHREGFAQLWMDINGADSWAKNPYVWAISFRRHNAGV